ncbi:MAG TPA: YtxH domain-containing protein [Chitinophagaceae bacterium]|nr:YtxH domain-containing protein [Chitinophagaceae bacterium]
MEWQTFAKGVLVGAIAGILLAPDSGKATRKKIARKASELKDSIEDTYDQFVDEVSQQVNNVTSKAKDIVHKGRQTVNDLKQETSMS